MDNNKVFSMSLGKVFSCLVAKAERKGRSRDEVVAVTLWLTGYTKEVLEELLVSDMTYGDFFRQAPAWNADSDKVTGTICGIRIQEIEAPLMKRVRILDKLVDEIAKGKPMEKILHR